MRHRRHLYRGLLVLLVLAAFALRAASLDFQSLWRDEVDALRFATAPMREVLSNFTRHGWNGPLYYLLLRGWIALTGMTEYAMRFSSLWFGVLCVPLVYVLGRRLFDRPTGLLGALLVSTSPYLTWYGQEVKMYALVPALALLAIYALRRAVEGDGWPWWVVQVTATSMAFYCHILAALLVPVQVLIALAWWPRLRRHWIGALVSLACLTIPYLPLANWQVGLAFQVRETGFTYYSLGQMTQILLSGWAIGILGSLGWGWPWIALLMCVLAAGGMGLSLWLSLAQARQGTAGEDSSLAAPPELDAVEAEGGGGHERLRRTVALVCWLVVPTLAVSIISRRQPLFTDRYLIWSAPAFYLLTAAGLSSLLHFEGWPRWAAIYLAGLIVVSNGVNLSRQATLPVKADFRAAAAYVANYQAGSEPASEPQPSAPECPDCMPRTYLPLVAADSSGGFDGLIVFQIPYARHTFDYYFPVERYAWAEGVYTNHRAPDGSYLMDEAGVAWRMEEMTEGYHVIWLVASEVQMWDERGLVQAWLERNAEQVDAAGFTHVAVYRYVR